MSDKKPAGYCKYILGVDCETTGLCFNNSTNNHSPVYNSNTDERHQAISWGFVIVDHEDCFNIVDELYVEVKWNEQSIKQRQNNPDFGKKAESVHGLTFTYLEQNGLSEEEALGKIGEFILRYFGPDNALKLLGHNVHMFDLVFLRDLFDRYNINLKFAHRHYDSNSLGFGTVGSWTSDALFETFGLADRDVHNALEDIKMTTKVFELTRALWDRKIGLKSYD